MKQTYQMYFGRNTPEGYVTDAQWNTFKDNTGNASLILRCIKSRTSFGLDLVLTVNVTLYVLVQLIKIPPIL